MLSSFLAFLANSLLGSFSLFLFYFIIFLCIHPSLFVIYSSNEHLGVLYFELSLLGLWTNSESNNESGTNLKAAWKRVSTTRDYSDQDFGYSNQGEFQTSFRSIFSEFTGDRVKNQINNKEISNFAASIYLSSSLRNVGHGCSSLSSLRVFLAYSRGSWKVMWNYWLFYEIFRFSLQVLYAIFMFLLVNQERGWEFSINGGL